MKIDLTTTRWRRALPWLALAAALYGGYAGLPLAAAAPLGETTSGRTSADPLFNLYVLKWGVHQIRLGLPDFWNANIFYPTRGALAFSDHLLGPAAQLALFLPSSPTPSPATTSCSSPRSWRAPSPSAWVLRRSGLSWTASALAGWMYAFSSFRLSQMAHLQLLIAQWIPLTLWFWDRLLARRTAKDAALFLLFYLLNLTGGCYLAYMIHFPMLAIFLSRAGLGEAGAALAPLAAAAGAGGPGRGRGGGRALPALRAGRPRPGLSPAPGGDRGLQRHGWPATSAPRVTTSTSGRRAAVPGGSLRGVGGALLPAGERACSRASCRRCSSWWEPPAALRGLRREAGGPLGARAGPRGPALFRPLVRPGLRAAGPGRSRALGACACRPASTPLFRWPLVYFAGRGADSPAGPALRPADAGGPRRGPRRRPRRRAGPPADRWEPAAPRGGAAAGLRLDPRRAVRQGHRRAPPARRRRGEPLPLRLHPALEADRQRLQRLHGGELPGAGSTTSRSCPTPTASSCCARWGSPTRAPHREGPAESGAALGGAVRRPGRATDGQGL